VAREAQVLGVSTDTHYVHLAWRRQHPELRELPYPMLADIKRELASALGIVHKKKTSCCERPSSLTRKAAPPSWV
jgi:alkyl hydroperoxide reductase subunit AhpC